MAILLAKEKLLLFFAALGFITIQCAIYLALHPWNWRVFAAVLSTAAPFVVANRYWRHRKLGYRLPREFTLVDALWSVGSIIVSLLLVYIVRP
jgi:hypothetical protein